MLDSATFADLPAVAALVNAAYRGESARQGWTHEADYLVNPRTNVGMLADDLARTGVRLLVVRDNGGGVLGCVQLEPAGDDAWYLGMLTVRPDLQAAQLGRSILAETEALARLAGVRRMRMTVVGRRDTLIAWYQRRGYVLTGETQPFAFAGEVRPDLTFVVLEKIL